MSFPSSLPVTLQRVRLRLARKGAASAYSHLQQIEVIRKALDRSGWPTAKAGAKANKTKASFGPAISVGYESEAEYCDVELNTRLDLQKGKESLEKCLPDGYSVVMIKSIPRFFPSLEQTVNAARYIVQSPLLENTKPKWDAMWASEHFMVTKKKADREEVIDARSCVVSWELAGQELNLVLRFGPRRTLKPERIIQAVCGLEAAAVEMGTPQCQLRINRKQLFLEKQTGDLTEP